MRSPREPGVAAAQDAQREAKKKARKDLRDARKNHEKDKVDARITELRAKLHPHKKAASTP